MKRTTRKALLTVALLVAAATAGAQTAPSGDPDPTSGVRVRADAVGNRVHVLAGGLAPEQRFSIGAGLVHSEYHILAYARADAAGQILVSVPIVADLGDEVWVMVVADSKGNVLASAKLTTESPILTAARSNGL